MKKIKRACAVCGAHFSTRTVRLTCGEVCRSRFGSNQSQPRTGDANVVQFARRVEAS